MGIRDLLTEPENIQANLEKFHNAYFEFIRTQRIQSAHLEKIEELCWHSAGVKLDETVLFVADLSEQPFPENSLVLFTNKVPCLTMKYTSELIGELAAERKLSMEKQRKLFSLILQHQCYKMPLLTFNEVMIPLEGPEQKNVSWFNLYQIKDIDLPKKSGYSVNCSLIFNQDIQIEVPYSKYVIRKAVDHAVRFQMTFLEMSKAAGFEQGAWIHEENYYFSPFIQKIIDTRHLTACPVELADWEKYIEEINFYEWIKLTYLDLNWQELGTYLKRMTLKI